MTTTDTPDTPATPVAMTAKDVLTALGGMWNPTEYIHIPEAPETADRAGRKLDALIVSCWRSRGHELDGVEIKVSMSDLKRELDNPAKADWWFDHVHRFWLAAPAPLAERIKGGACDFPTGWGLLACHPDAPPKVLIKPTKHEAQPLSWGTNIGLLRAALGNGFQAVAGAEQRGYQRGVARGRESVARGSADEVLQAELAALRRTVADFEAVSGIKLTDSWSAGQVGEAVKVLMRARTDPTVLARNLNYSIEELTRTADRLTQLRTAIANVTGDQPIDRKDPVPA